ncbi:hypothetical protein AVEN_9573-1 [Araneus ventricosus]|uniref:Endonuclease/exonuclease/phosphatase domain-containing protein n=1 Tax=Araneus ventricosus TaxID=182803 RepID=A0A4Y2H7Z7_ARAVE|nr:hypothetical protein AVEN_9573-1 [Araneus ventricosus]
MRVLQKLNHIDFTCHLIVLDIIYSLHSLEKRCFDVIFSWIPGHVGIEDIQFYKNSKLLFERALHEKLSPLCLLPTLRSSPSLGRYGCPNPEVPRDLYSLLVYPLLCLLLIHSIPRRQARELSMRSCFHSACFFLLMDSPRPRVFAVCGDPLDGCFKFQRFATLKQTAAGHLLAPVVQWLVTRTLDALPLKNTLIARPGTTLTSHASLQAVAVQVHARTLLTVCCVYLPPHDVVSQQNLDTLVDQLPTPFILLGDFNGHSTLWESDFANSRRRQIERLISNNCLCLLNNDEKTYFHEPTRIFHSLDLAICTSTLLPLLNFTVGSDLCNSDNILIIVSYADSGREIQYPPRYLFQRGDWGNFMQLAHITESMVSNADITEAVQNVIDRSINAANNIIPKCSPRLRKFRRPWWNEA